MTNRSATKLNPATFRTPSGMTLNEAAKRLEGDMDALQGETERMVRNIADPTPYTETVCEYVERLSRQRDINAAYIAECRVAAGLWRQGVYRSNAGKG